MYIHKPEVIDGRWTTLAFEVEKCPICCKPMVVGSMKHLEKAESILAAAYDGGNTIKAQMKRAGFSYATNSTDKNDRDICKECEDKGHAAFLCVLCKIEQDESQIKDVFGSPPEFLCNKCYETVPAKTWEEEVERLEEKHHYDWD